jgi:hypothetical protein
MRHSSDIAFRARFALAWLAVGAAVATWLPLSVHDTRYGWSAAYWLLAAPILMLAVRSFGVRQGMARAGRAVVRRPRRTEFRSVRGYASPRRLRSMRFSSSRMMAR